MVPGLSRVLTISLKYVYTDSSQPQWEMRRIAISSGSRDALQMSRARHGRFKRHQEERKNQRNFSEFVFQ